MRFGSFVMNPMPWPLSPTDPLLNNNGGAPDRTLFQVALHWLREDREYRRELEKAGRKIRGARRSQVRTPLAMYAIIWGGRLIGKRCEPRMCRQVPRLFIGST